MTNVITISNTKSMFHGAGWSGFTALMATAATAAALAASTGSELPAFLVSGFVFFGTLPTVFLSGLRQHPYPSVGVQFFLGNQTGEVYAPGWGWVYPFLQSSKVVPGPEQELSLSMPATEPEAKDHVTVHIGRRRQTVLQVKIVDPKLYVKINNPQLAIESSYENQARLFVNQMESVVNIVDEKALFEEYLELMPLPDDVNDPDFITIKAKYDDLKSRLANLKYDVENADGVNEPHHVFADGAESVMLRAGTLRKEALGWGIRIINMFMPSVELPSSIAAAAEAKQAMREQNEVLELRAEAFTRTAQKLKEDLGLTGTDAADRVGMMSGQPITRTVTENRNDNRLGLSGPLEDAGIAVLSAVPELAGKVIANFTPVKGSKPNRAARRTRRSQAKS